MDGEWLDKVMWQMYYSFVLHYKKQINFEDVVPSYSIEAPDRHSQSGGSFAEVLLALLNIIDGFHGSLRVVKLMH